MPFAVVAELDGAWNDATGASYEKIAIVVACTAEIVMAIAMPDPEPCPVLHRTCVLVTHENVLQIVSPIRADADAIDGPKL